MACALLSLRAHRDLAKFDLEDGVRRRIAIELLADDSSISRIVVDLRAETQGAPEGSPTEADALLWLEADEADHVDPDRIGSRLDDVAAELTGWWVDTTELRPLESSWVGAATPGVKVVYFLRRSTVSDDFDRWLDDATQTAAARMVAGGAAYHRVVGETHAAPALDAVVTFWFPTTARLAEAESHGVFDALRDPSQVDADQTTRLVVFEHRLVPNENTRATAEPDPSR